MQRIEIRTWNGGLRSCHHKPTTMRCRRPQKNLAVSVGLAMARNRQFNLKVSNETQGRFYRMADEKKVPVQMEDGEHVNAEPANGSDEAKAMEEFAQLPNTMPDIGVDLYGFATEDLANAVGQEVLSALRAFSKLLNLKRLLRVVVSYDYH
jgi:hypothetical protein